MKFKEMNNEDILHHYACVFTANSFVEDKTLEEELEECKQELISRLEKRVVIPRDLKSLLVDANILESEEAKKEVFELLKEYLKLNTTPINKKARVIITMDKSGSMGTWEFLVAKSLMTWIEMISVNTYTSVTVDCIGFHTEAEMQSRYQFYSTGKTGGTIVSSGLNIANNLNNYYDHENEDVYTFLISDGDNLSSDNERTVRIINDIARKSKEFVYFETNQYGCSSTLSSGFKLYNLDSDNICRYIINTKEDVLNILKVMFSE